MDNDKFSLIVFVIITDLIMIVLAHLFARLICL